MKKVGMIGWRGMVGTVLRTRMEEENDFSLMDPYFFSTSQPGKNAPSVGQKEKYLRDAFNLEQLSEMEILISTQGGSYTEKIHPKLREIGWKGFWVDAASTLRMSNDSVIVLDPINQPKIERGLEQGVKDLIGSNCSVAIIMMAIGGLLLEKEIEWISVMTYQAVSGAGARAMEELLEQMEHFISIKTSCPTLNMMELEKKLKQSTNSTPFPLATIGHPLAGNLLPWIDRCAPGGRSREEWKGPVEMNKILGNAPDHSIPIDGTAVRIATLRCHSVGLTLKLKRDLPVERIEEIIAQQNQWIKIIPNEKEVTLEKLTPMAVSGTLEIGVGRIRKMTLGPEYLNVFAVGDQLLWGAAEPLRRAVRMILSN